MKCGKEAEYLLIGCSRNICVRDDESLTPGSACISCHLGALRLLHELDLGFTFLFGGSDLREEALALGASRALERSALLAKTNRRSDVFLRDT